MFNIKDMKKVFVSLLLLCMSIIVLAQSKKSLVTPQMSNKVAYYVKNHRGFSTTIFCNVNRLNGLYELDKALASIDKHPEYIENFIIEVFCQYGTGDHGYVAFKDFGYTTHEYDIALNIYNNWRKTKQLAAEKEQKKVIAEEQAQYDQWAKEGIPDNAKRSKNFKFASFKMNATALASYIEEKLGFRNQFINNEYNIEIDKNGMMTVTPQDIILEKVRLSLESSSGYEFKNLKKKLCEPSKHTLRIVEERKLAFSNKELKIEWNKNENAWVLSKPSVFEKEIGTTTYYAVCSGLSIAINNMPELQTDKKKHTVLVTAYISGTIKCYLDRKESDVCVLQDYYNVKFVK